MTQPLLGTVDDNGFVWTVPRQLFVKLYVASGDADAAARDSKLPQDDSAEDLLQEESVQQAIAILHEQVLARVHESADTVTARYSNIAEGNIFDYLDTGNLHAADNANIQPGNVKLKDWRKMDRHMQQRVKKVKFTTNAQGDTNFELELHDPMRANEMLVKLLGLDGDDGDDDAKSFAEQIRAFMTEVEQLDDHYDYEAESKTEGTDAPEPADESGAPENNRAKPGANSILGNTD